MQIAHSHRQFQRDWSEDFGKRGVGLEVCEQCQNAFIGARRRKVCRRCHDERESTRKAKERAKLDELALAKETAEESERMFRSLVSFHQVEPTVVTWLALAGEPSPIASFDSGFVDRSSWRHARLANPTEQPPPEPQPANSPSASAHPELMSRWQENRALAKRIVLGDITAYPEALQAHGSFADLLNLGIAVDVTVESAKRLVVEVLCTTDSVIPAVSRTLTSTGKLSEKNLPRTRHQEIYQDHVCSVMLRVARECFAVLPIDLLLLNGKAVVGAKADTEKPVATIYSVLMDRSRFERLGFLSLDPSDSVADFPHRGDFKAARKAGAFSPVEPLTFAVARENPHDETMLSSLRAQAATMRVRLQEFQSLNES